MTCEVECALAGQPWAVSGTIFGLDRVLDEEGRPLAERRAPSDAKVGVEILLEDCPYHDERQGRPMNASALLQVQRHYKRAVAEFEEFRAQLPAVQGWHNVLVTVIDALFEPARGVLEARDATLAVPARSAVKHKLAAGYFGALREVAYEEAAGRCRSVTAEEFGALLREKGSLLGASEVCAGPPAMIRAATRAIVSPASRPGVAVEARRARLAEILAEQMRVGVAWELFDLAHERAFFEGNPAGTLKARNDFLRRRFELRRLELQNDTTLPIATPAPRLPGVGAIGDELALALRRHSECPIRDLPSARRALAFGEGAASLPGPAVDQLVGRLAGYVEVYCEVWRIQWKLEGEARALLGYDPEVPLKPNPIIISAPRWLDWAETILGHRVRVEAPPTCALSLKNHLRTLDWLAA